MNGFEIFRSLCAMLAALLMLAASPAAALDRCGTDSGPCLVLCGDADCDLPAGDEGDATKGCAHCGFGHSGSSLSAPAGASQSDAFDRSSAGYPLALAAVMADTLQDGPEHPPKV